MTLDAGIAAYLERVAALGLPPAWELPLEQVRAGYRATSSVLWGEDVPAASSRDIEIAGPGGALPLRLYTPAAPASPAAAPAGTLVWFHGGGWVLGDLDSHDQLCRGLAARSGATVASVDYRLAPEHRYPAAVEDAWAATLWATSEAAARHGLDPARVAVGGDSAGGNLAAVTALRARDVGLRLRLQALVYPVVEGRFDTESYAGCGEGYGLTRAAMEWYWETYAPGEAKLEAEASPLRAATLAGSAPALVQTAEYDVLRSEGDAYADRLAAAGVAVTHTRWAGTNHGFLRLPGVTPVAGAALDELAAALRAALA